MRGADLLGNTPRLLLQRCLGYLTPPICMSRWRATPLAKTLEADSGYTARDQQRARHTAAAWAFLRQDPLTDASSVPEFWSLAAEELGARTACRAATDAAYAKSIIKGSPKKKAPVMTTL